MSGVVFLFCCGLPKVQAAETESCPFAKKNHCDKSVTDSKSSAAENAVRFEIAQSDCPAFNCCGFLPQVFDKIKKAEQRIQIAEVSNRMVIESPAFVFIEIKSDSFAAYRPRPLNQSGTYLKNRVFRI